MNNKIITHYFGSYTGKTNKDTIITTDNSVITEHTKNYVVVSKTSYITKNKNILKNIEPTEEENIIKDVEKSNYKTVLTPAF
jgi:hypothetical protein